jgi:hypothetical protein
MGVTPRWVKLNNGVVVTRQESLPVLMLGGMVPCAPYDDHFVYATTEPHQSAYMCTCGSPAVIVNLGNGGLMFVCLFHMYEGVHATGGRTWI